MSVNGADKVSGTNTSFLWYPVTEATEWRWQFLGFESEAEGQPVQSWFDGLHEDVKDEIRDLIRYLEKLTNKRWRRPEFDGLKGEQDISELRPREVSVEINGEIETFTYRIYGFFGPIGRNDIYTFLHAARKTERNDRSGKRIARNRLKQLELGRATIHRFSFYPEQPCPQTEA